MFKRELQVKMVKTPRTTETPEFAKPKFDYDKIEEIASKSLKRLAIAGVAVYAAVVAINTVAEIVTDKNTHHDQ